MWQGSSVGLGGRAFFVGGGGGSFSGPHSMEIYDVAADRWTSTLLPTIRDQVAATVVGSRALFAGGHRVSLSTATTTLFDEVDIYEGGIGSTYCAPASPNSTGAPARLSVSGFPGAASQGFAHLSADAIPTSAIGYFLASRTQASVAGPGGSQGTLCLGGAIGRFVGPGQIQVADPSGRFALSAALTSLPQPTGAFAAAAGETWNFQAWYRDANPGPTSNFTDAVSVTFL